MRTWKLSYSSPNFISTMSTVPFTLHFCRFTRYFRKTLFPTSSITLLNPPSLNFRRTTHRRISFSASTFSRRFSTVASASSSRGAIVSSSFPVSGCQFGTELFTYLCFFFCCRFGFWIRNRKIWCDCSWRRTRWLRSCSCFCTFGCKNSSSYSQHWQDCVAGFT